MEQPPDSTEKVTAEENSRKNRQPIPWVWLISGIVITIVACGLSFLLINNFLFGSSNNQINESQPTLIILTAPPSATPAPTGSALPPTAIPTFTPIPTPDTAVAPEELLIGFYAIVANTDGLGVTFRGGPSTQNVALQVLEEDTVVLIIEGPVDADNFSWWHVELSDGTEGWVVGDFLAPSAAP